MPNAMRGDLPELPDGIYQISIDNSLLQFMVYTVNTGTLEGQRILKRQTAEGWKGFATLQVADPEHPAGDTAYAGVHLWQSQRRTVSVAWVNQVVAMAIRSFIQRVQDVPEDHFIVIQDCPEIPDHIRSRLNPPEVDPLDRLINDRVDLIAESQRLPRTPRQSRRITSLAMSAFDPRVVR